MKLTKIFLLSIPLLSQILAPRFAWAFDSTSFPFDDIRQKIKHVFIITLENESVDKAFGQNSPAPYLSKTLTSQGVFLSKYYGTGHASLDNYIAMISGQPATPETRNDCQTFADFQLKGTTPDGLAIGSGCVYPAAIKTLPNQLTAVGKTWRGYMEDMGNDPSREASVCGHPALNTIDHTQSAEKPSSAVPAGDQYATRHNPFVYFHSIIDTPECLNVVNLNRLPQDLARESTTPNFVFITPNLCDDGHDAPCVNGQPGGLVSADQFLQKWVPIITASPAFKKGGLLIINFDESDAEESKEASGNVVVTFQGEHCCSQEPGPNLAAFPQTSTIANYSLDEYSFGGDRTGAVMLSPFLKPGTVSNTAFNHYSLLKTVEEIFNVGYLGYAGAPGLVDFFGCTQSDVKTSTGGEFAKCRHDEWPFN